MQNLHRHGELVLKPSKIPAKAKLVKEAVKSHIVAHSESGHHHVLTAQKISVYEVDGKTYLDVQGNGKLEHQKQSVDKHKTQVIKPGAYEVVIKREFDYYSKAMRQVQD